MNDPVVVLDSGVLDRASTDHRFRATLRHLVEGGWSPIIPTVVLAEAVTGGARDAPVNHLLRRLGTVTTDDPTTRDAPGTSVTSPRGRVPAALRVASTPSLPRTPPTKGPASSSPPTPATCADSSTGTHTSASRDPDRSTSIPHPPDPRGRPASPAPPSRPRRRAYALAGAGGRRHATRGTRWRCSGCGSICEYRTSRPAREPSATPPWSTWPSGPTASASTWPCCRSTTAHPTGTSPARCP